MFLLHIILWGKRCVCPHVQVKKWAQKGEGTSLWSHSQMGAELRFDPGLLGSRTPVLASAPRLIKRPPDLCSHCIIFLCVTDLHALGQRTLSAVKTLDPKCRLHPVPWRLPASAPAGGARSMGLPLTLLMKWNESWGQRVKCSGKYTSPSKTGPRAAWPMGNWRGQGGVRAFQRLGPRSWSFSFLRMTMSSKTVQCLQSCLLQAASVLEFQKGFSITRFMV